MKKVINWIMNEYEMTEEEVKSLPKEERDFFIRQYIEFVEGGK